MRAARRPAWALGLANVAGIADGFVPALRTLLSATGYPPG